MGAPTRVSSRHGGTEEATPARRSPFESPRPASSFPAGPAGGAAEETTVAPAVPAGSRTGYGQDAAAAPAAPAASSAPPLPWASPATDRPASVAPATTGPAAAEPAPGPTPSPFDALVGADQPVRAGSASSPVVDEDDEDWDDEHESSYTWLHYIVLVVVAFVLGLLLWKLLLDGSDDADFTTDAAPAAAATLTIDTPGGAA
ncbi:hypothetical protein [Isoptericola sp. BMS4]|uniref:hypothetical protein n=1 Tax=Isoptericola sp. BMS4 TaxID=2527875 RepID=UPI001423014D|nr:hypothetical protein [Isoptericola sp. BMS4]